MRNYFLMGCFCLLLPACMGGEARQEEQAADTLADTQWLQGVWLDDNTESPVFKIKGDSIYYASQINAPLKYDLKNDTLIDEVRMVFEAADRSLEEGRRQVARIVGRDTSGLTDTEVRTAALETLAENLSDGVIAPLFWYLLLGVPGMLAYKMVNTLDSMIGYRNERYRAFGCFAARLDDVANYLPARLTAFLMVLVTGRLSLLRFVFRYGPRHASPNSGYPEAALAGILDCRFGGPHQYFGEWVYKPFIGSHERPLTSRDMQTAIRINRRAELLMLLIILFPGWLVS